MAIRKVKNGYQVDVTNRRHRSRIRQIVKTKAEAIELEAKIRRDIKKQPTSARSLGHALERYLNGEATNLKSYNSIISIARAIRPHIAGKTMDQAGETAGEIKRAMLADGLKPATINRRLALLRRLCNLAYDWGWIDQPVSRRIKLLPGETERHYYLTPDQVDQLASHCQYTASLIRIAAYTGLRRGELLGLQPENIKQDFIILGSDTKTARPRLVPIPEQIKQDINDLPLPLPKNTNYLLRLEFEVAREIIGLPHIRFHDLRHTYASLLAQAGATLQLIGKAMGHSTPIMTNRYAHLTTDNLKSLAERFKNIK